MPTDSATLLSVTPLDLDGVSLVFDLDGTLIDSAPDLAAALNHVLVSEGRDTVSAASVRMLVGHGARVLIERGFAETGTPAPPDTLPGLVARFVDYYREHIADGSRPFAGVAACLDRLKAQGARLGVCTNKPEALATLVLDKLDLAGYFGTAVIGADTLPVRKPDPAPYREVTRRLGGPLARSLMIGDSPTDAATARAAGVPFIAVSYGYSPVPAAALGADIVIDHFDSLDAAVATVVRPA